MNIEPIALVHTDFPTKFGLPRQAGLAGGLKGTITFLPPWNDENAVRGLSGFDYIWVIWGFSEAKESALSATVRPPLLGGRERRGVFATRSPNRPNHLALSSLRLLGVEKGPSLVVESPDMMDGSPIYDIKPYLPSVDVHPGARGGFTDTRGFQSLEVDCGEALLSLIPEEKREGLLSVLRSDPRPRYLNDEERVHGFFFSSFEIRFRVRGGVLHVCSIDKRTRRQDAEGDPGEKEER